MSLTPRVVLGALDLTDVPYALGFGGDLGAPQNVYELLSSLLADGELVGSSRSSNRTISLTVYIDGADMHSLADSEATLIAECDKQRNTLTFDPGDGFGSPTVFETFRVQVRQPRSDDHELALLRQYDLEIQALPYGRSVNKVTDSAVAADWSTGTVYDDGTSTTNWSGWLVYRTPGKAIVGGAVEIEYGSKVVRSAVSDGEGFTEWHNKDTRSGLSISTGTGGYLSVVIRLERQFDSDVALNFGGIAQSRVDSIAMTTSTGATIAPTFSAVEQFADGSVRYAWAVDAGLTIAGITFDSYQYAYAYTSPSDPHVYYDDLRLSTTTTTSNQYAKVVEVGGSVRSPGSIHVSASVALGSLLLCSVPDDQIAAGFTPDVTKWKTAGPVRTADAAVINGGYFTPNTYTFEVPVSMLTEGAYTVVMLNRRLTGDPMTSTVTASLRIGASQVGDATTITNTEPSDGGTTGTYRLFTVGELYLPIVPVNQPDSTTKIRLVVTGSGFAEFWLIPTWGDLTMVDCGTGTVSASGPSSNFWADSPSPDRPMGAWWRGPSSDRALARSAVNDLLQPGRHLLNPPRTRVFVASSAAQGPAVTVDYYPHWAGYAAS